MLEGADGPVVMEVNSRQFEGIERATGSTSRSDHRLRRRPVAFPEIDVRQRLSVSAGYGVVDHINEGAALVTAGTTIGELCEQDTGAHAQPRYDRDSQSEKRPHHRGHDRLLCFETLRQCGPRSGTSTEPACSPSPTNHCSRTAVPKRSCPIGDTEAVAGKRTQTEIPIGRLMSGTPFALPVVVVHGKSDGPTM